MLERVGIKKELGLRFEPASPDHRAFPGFDLKESDERPRSLLHGNILPCWFRPDQDPGVSHLTPVSFRVNDEGIDVQLFNLLKIHGKL